MFSGPVVLLSDEKQKQRMEIYTDDIQSYFLRFGGFRYIFWGPVQSYLLRRETVWMSRDMVPLPRELRP